MIGRCSIATVGSGRSLPWLLDHRARERAEHVFVVWEPFAGERKCWTYAAFAAEVANVAGGLATRGVRPGDRIMIHLENCPEYLTAWFAVVRLGAIAVCTNTRSTQTELAYFVAHSGTGLAITQPEFADVVALAHPPGTHIVIVSGQNKASLPPGRDDFEALRHSEPAAAIAIGDLHPASIQYTSGTTGRPKAVVWTHANCLWGAKVNASHAKLTSADVQLVYAPLYHTNAQSYSVLACLWSGGTLVLQPRFSSSRYWNVSVRNQCTFSSQLYFTLRALAGLEVPPDHSFRLWGTGMNSHPIAQKLGIPTIGWWGMTETISHPIVGDPELPDRALTIGRAAPEYEVAIVNESGSVVQSEETGNLLVRGVRGVSLFAEYFRDDAATEAAFNPEGWLLTGDRVTPHADGCITFADRAKDMLRVGSENVAASEIERVITGVKGISEAAVVGAPDDMLDEVPVAFIVVRPGASDPTNDVLAACREHLAPFKIPRELRIVDDLPRAALGKVAKHALRERLELEYAKLEPIN